VKVDGGDGDVVAIVEDQQLHISRLAHAVGERHDVFLIGLLATLNTAAAPLMNPAARPRCRATP
jgi:hypothetical protein